MKSVKKIALVIFAALLLGGTYLAGRASVAFESVAEDPRSSSQGVTEAIEPMQNEKFDLFRIGANLKRLRKTVDEKFLFEIDNAQLEDYIYKGFMQGLHDPYSVYYTAEEYKSLMEKAAGEYAGVGLVVTANARNYIEVVSPIKGTPAERAGLKTGDLIAAVDGSYFSGDQLDEAVTKMKGEPGTEVSLSISRPKGNDYESLEVKIVREMIALHSVESQMLNDGIGYILVTSFEEKTAGDFLKALDGLKAQGARGIILDLRNNPGGLLNAVNEMADVLLPQGDIVSTVDKHGQQRSDKSDSAQEDIPMVCLVNEGSASASEIMAGALKDYGRAEIIGTKTFGKGIVQQIVPFGDTGGAIKMTVSEFYTPKGNPIHKKGIEPDQVVELNEDAKSIGPDNLDQDNQLKVAIEVLNEKIK